VTDQVKKIICDENALKYCLNKLETKSERLPDSAKRDAIGDIIYVNGDT
jgi:hypothetical protein